MTVNSVAKHFWYTSRKCSAKSPATLNACTQPRTICSRSLVIKSMKQEKRLVQRCNNIRQRFYSVNSDRVIINSPGILKVWHSITFRSIRKCHFCATLQPTTAEQCHNALTHSNTSRTTILTLHIMTFSLKCRTFSGFWHYEKCSHPAVKFTETRQHH